MFSLSNQIKSPDDEEEDQPEDCDNSLAKDASNKQTFLTYNYNHHFEQTYDFTANSLIPLNQKSPDFDFASQNLKSQKRRAEVFESHGGGGGGRVLQSTGRKDRHSKVRTARGPRDRRVRLSPRTAIQFYDVQDRLGYDRPSKAIDWLIREAKSAIDALNQHPNAAENHGGFLINDGNPVSEFGFCIDGAAAPPPAAEFDFNSSADLIHHQGLGFCSAFTETNWELARLQKMLNWNENSGNVRGGGDRAGYYSSVNPPPLLCSPAPPISGHFLSQREPLQSSFINYSPISNADFPAFSFCNELLNVTASATLMKEDEREKKLAFNRPSPTGPFLQFED
ncbi:hypothetical protein ACS0TY_018108 [Phlomoides rotata]